MVSGRGNFLSAVGLPCSGKSSVMQALGQKTGYVTFSEPEEKDWPVAVQNSQDVGMFTTLMWFRSVRVPMLIQAEKLAQLGEGVIVDSYYDKLMYYYLDKPGMEWLINKHDPYFQVLKEVACIDSRELPNASCLVVFEIEYEDWKYLLRKRNRAFMDNDETFLQKGFHTQQHFREAAYQSAQLNATKLIPFKQSISDPKTQAEKLYEILVSEGVIT